MSSPQHPVGAVIEIIEKRIKRFDGISGECIFPSEVRVNGQSILIPKDFPPKIHEVEVPGDGAVLVTLTVIAKRIVVGIEEPEAEPQPVATWGVGGGQDPREGIPGWTPEAVSG